MAFSDFVLLVPKNDEESLMIGRIAQAVGIPLLVSPQPHGARLSHESRLVERLRAVNPHATRVVIVEIPGVSEEAVLEAEGFTVVIIDHHRYDEIDRMQAQSSLEQFLAYFHIDDEILRSHGFDPMLVRGVGIIDRGFLWALRAEVPDVAAAQRIRDYYRSLTLALGKDREEIEKVAKVAWDAREMHGNTIVVRSPRRDVGIRDAISFLIADTFSTPQETVILEGDRRILVQESEHVRELFARYGGFTFGHDRCWGVQVSPEKPLPPVEAILQILGS